MALLVMHVLAHHSCKHYIDCLVEIRVAWMNMGVTVLGGVCAYMQAGSASSLKVTTSA